jgi:adenine-specific DNA-methyltransferase
VAITPRSFCNGPYFRPFREFLLRETAIRRVHVFESRTAAFCDEEVLQENVILHAVRHVKPPASVTITSSEGLDGPSSSRRVRRAHFVHQNDPESFIHIAPEKDARTVAARMACLTHSLPDLGLSVSTGRVVDFRAREFLRQQPEAGTVPLIYPVHFEGGYIVWPKEKTRKPNALAQCDQTMALLIPNGNYVLTKRFTAKEEARRVVAVVHDGQRIGTEFVGFENHVNYFHRNGRGLGLELARGLAAFLNSTIVDQSFRHFSGHTQVNATDLRNMRYPSLDDLARMGSAWESVLPDQQELDALVERTVFNG